MAAPDYIYLDKSSTQTTSELAWVWTNQNWEQPVYGKAFNGYSWDSNPIDDGIRATAIGLSGWGGLTSVVRMGRDIEVISGGYDERDVRLTINGVADGMLAVGGSGSASAEVIVGLKNKDSKSLVSSSVVDISGARLDGESVSKQFSEVIDTEIDQNDKYTIIMQLSCSVSVQGSAASKAKFGKGNSDNWEGGVQFTSAEWEFTD